MVTIRLIAERKTRVEVEDYSLWHYLIFCKEFVNDDYENDFVCWVCDDLVSGHPVFKCLECGFVQHKSCSQLLDLTKMNVGHDITQRHHLISREAIENNGKEEAICLGCKKLVSGPTYRCSVPHCTFHLHKSCNQLSHAIQHIVHPDHTLILQLPSPTASCSICKRYRKKDPLLYACCICNFDMDIKCLLRWDFIESEKKIEAKDYSMWHYLVFCEEFVSDDCKDDVSCWVCEESLSGHPAFKCLECGFAQHKLCSQLPDLTEMNVGHDITERHHLILRDRNENNGKKEAIFLGCRKLVSGPTYRCSVSHCTFYLHKSCDQLSHAIQHYLHPDHALLLSLPSPDVYCNLCGRYRKDPLLYTCRICNFDVDIKCLPRWDFIENEKKMEAKDYIMWHYLIFCEEFSSDDRKEDVNCWVCEESVSGHPTFKCLECGFVQHKLCSQLPELIEMNVRHDITKRHHLILRDGNENNGKKEAICLGCGKLVFGPTYRCSVPQCTFHLHKSCDQLSHAIQHIVHLNHTLLLRLPSPTASCGVCKRYRKKDPLLYDCRICNFDVDIKCLLRWDFIESEKKMEAEDYSMWHYLIFCEEFMSDNYENNIICWVCEELVSRNPAFKCLECNFVQHKSCSQLQGLTEMGIKHDITCRHHLILKEEMGNNDKKEVLCLGCGKTTSGAAYRCSIPECTFHLHTSCHHLSHAIQHIAHRKHPLFLKLAKWRTYCDLCGEHRDKKTMLYACPICIFNMDMKCASPEIIDDDCDQHLFVAGRKPIKFTCEACGEETEDVACQCSSCRVLCHLYCTHYPRIIKIKRHRHLFSRTYCLHQVKNLENAICKLCCRKVNTKYGAYYCQVCDYIIHMKCAKQRQDKSTTNSKVNEFDDYTRHLVYLVDRLNAEEDKTVIAPSKTHHFSHPQHQLILLHEDRMCDKRLSKNDKQCEACMRFIIFSPFYGCEECNIFFHKRCSEIPEIIWRTPFSKDISTLSSKSSSKQLFFCGFCGILRHGFFYDLEDKGKFKSDIQCFLIPETINNECHEHLLHLPMLNDIGLKEICSGCGRKIDGEHWRLMCSECNFWLCFKCARLPNVARYKYHPHLLKLTGRCKDDLDECYCLICEKKRDSKHWCYYCADCDFAAHIQCVIGSPLKSGRHEHPVTLIEENKDTLECQLCETSIRDEMALECAQCEFNFHIECYYLMYT